MLRRLREPGKPSELLATVALYAGALALLPLMAPAAAAVSALVALLASILMAYYPEKHAGRRKVYTGLALCLLGMGLFFAEGTLFWRWKIQQAYDQRLAISRLRLSQVAQAFEAYRQEMGSYPEVSGIFLARDLLEPKYALAFPSRDGFDGAISVTSRPEGFVASVSPPPPPGSAMAPPPIVTKRDFQPAPPPPPTLPPEGVSPGPPAEDLSPLPPAGGPVPPAAPSAGSSGGAPAAETPQPKSRDETPSAPK